MKNIKLKAAVLSSVMVLALSVTACNKDGGVEGTGTTDRQSAAPMGTVEPVNTEDNSLTVPENSTEKTNPPEESAATNTEPAPSETELTQKQETEPIVTTTPPPAEISPVEPPLETANKASQIAAAQVGKMFKFGGASPEQGFDNSGIVYYALTQSGIKCPRTAPEMSKIGEKKTADKLQAGDIAFFNMDNAEKTLFVALYIGEGKAVISTDEDQPVKIVDINSVWYKNAFAYGISPQA